MCISLTTDTPVSYNLYRCLRLTHGPTACIWLRCLWLLAVFIDVHRSIGLSVSESPEIDVSGDSSLLCLQTVQRVTYIFYKTTCV